jgi:hypothetical protein
VHVIGHDHITHQQKLVPFTNRSQRAHKQVSCANRSQQRQPTVTTEGDKVQVAAAVIAFQILGHQWPPQEPTCNPDTWGTQSCRMLTPLPAQWYPPVMDSTAQGTKNPPGPPAQEKAMTTKIAAILLYVAVLLVISGPCWAQQKDNASECSTVYENHNQTDYGPLKVRVVEGTSVIQVGSQEQPGAPGACFALFTEKDHKRVASVKADSEGHFKIKDVAPGHYRLVARAQGLCTANIPLEVVKSSRDQKRGILVHFRPTGIDTCSYGEVAPVAAKDPPTTR